MTVREVAIVGVACFVLGALGGVGVMAYLESRDHVAQVYQPEIRTSPSDVAPEVKPNAKPEFKAPTAPRGTTILRTTELTVRPTDAPTPTTDTPAECVAAADTFQCPPVRLRLDLGEADGQWRMLARAENGEIMAAQDIPLSAMWSPRSKRITLVGNPDGDIIGTYQQGAGRFAWAVSGWQIDGKPGAGVGGSISFQ